MLDASCGTSSIWSTLVNALSKASITRRALSKVKHSGGVRAITLRSSPWVATTTFSSFNLLEAVLEIVINNLRNYLSILVQQTTSQIRGWFHIWPSTDNFYSNAKPEATNFSDSRIFGHQSSKPFQKEFPHHFSCVHKFLIGNHFKNRLTDRAGQRVTTILQKQIIKSRWVE